MDGNLSPELIGFGHEVELIPEKSPFTGQAGIIAINSEGVRTAVHDPRGEGNSLAQITVVSKKSESM